MVRLVLDLLKERRPGAPVPFLVPIASWNPVTQGLREWLTDQLVIDHPALRHPNPMSENSCAHALLAGGLIRPLLDGLDEIPQALRGAAISRINDALLPGEAIVVTCRTEEYRRAVRPLDSPEITPRGAAAIQLKQLNVEMVADYLLSDAGGPEAKKRWEPVIRALRKDTPVGQALITPLMAGMARVIYNPRPGELTGDLRDPSDLLSLTLGGPVAVEEHLFDAFVPAAYRSAKRWSAKKAEPFFLFLAHHLEQRIKSPDLAWWPLRRAVFSSSRTMASRLSNWSGWLIAVLIIQSLYIYLPRHISLDIAIALGLGGGLVSSAPLMFGVLVGYSGVLPSPQVRLLSNPRLRIPVAFGLIVVLVLLLLIRYIVGLRIALGLGLGLGALLALTASATLEGVEGDLSTAPSPRAMLYRDQRASLVIASTVFLAAVLAVVCIAIFSSGAVFKWNAGHSYQYWVCLSLIIGMTLGFAWTVNETAWPAYTFVQIWLAMHHRLPWALMDFLEDAHQRGVLRQSGAVYQFRHIELQSRLAARYMELSRRSPQLPVTQRTSDPSI